MGMGIHGEWQTCNDSLTIRECHSPNGYANDHRCLRPWNSLALGTEFIRRPPALEP